MTFTINFARSPKTNIPKEKVYTFEEWVELICTDNEKALASESTVKCLAAYRNSIQCKIKYEKNLTRAQHDELAVYIRDLEDVIIRMGK